jgi:hypothetical protein
VRTVYHIRLDRQAAFPEMQNPRSLRRGGNTLLNVGHTSREHIWALISQTTVTAPKRPEAEK